MKKYIVYKHTCPNGKCYIGVTGQTATARWQNGKGYEAQLFGKAVKKYGWKNITHEVLLETDALEKAYDEEIRQIRLNNSMDKRFGYNCDAGGAGSTGHTVSDEQLESMRERAKKMWENSETREKLLKHLKELGESHVGKKMKITDKIKKNAIRRGKRVNKYAKSGEFICTYRTMMEAARDCGVGDCSAIVACCKKTKKSAYGFLWSYEGSTLTKDDIEYSNSVKSIGKKVEMLSDDGEKIAEFDSLHEAGRQLGISFKAIHSAVKTGRRCNNARWRYIN